MSTTAPPESTDSTPLVNLAGGEQPAAPFKYEDNSDQPSGGEAFDKMFPADNGEPKPEPKPEPAPKEPAKVSLDDGLPADPKTAPEPVKETPKPVPEPKSAPELRKAYQAANEAIAAREKELAELRSQLTSKPKVDLNGEAEVYQTKIKELEERLSERETALKFADYSLSREYKETYQAPLDEAIKSAGDYVGEFNVTQVDGKERAAVLSDMAPLIQMRAGEAWKAAREIFGENAPAIMQHRDRIVALNQKARNALDEFRTKGAEQMKQAEEEMTQKEQEEVRERINLFENHIASRQTTHKSLYAPDEADPDGNRLLSEGQRLTKIAFLGDPNLELEAIVKIQAEVAARAAAFGRVVHRSRALETKVAELEKKLKSLETSEPGRGSRDTGDDKGASRSPSWEEELDRLPAYR